MKGFIISHFMVTCQGNILKICIMNNCLSLAHQKMNTLRSSIRFPYFVGCGCALLHCKLTFLYEQFEWLIIKEGLLVKVDSRSERINKVQKTKEI